MIISHFLYGVLLQEELHRKLEHLQDLEVSFS
jgi:hypothetical protein